MKVLIVLVLYKIKLCESIAYNTLMAAINNMNCNKNICFFVYDNSPNLNPPLNNSQVVKYVHDSANGGLSKAYNSGALFANENNFEYILLSDQDTYFVKSFFYKLFESINNNPEIKIFAPILKLEDGRNFSPTLYKYKRGHPISLIPNKKYSLYTYSPVNSGMVIDRNFFLSVGGYNEKVRLDFADFQFIEKARRKTQFFYLLDVICLQEFSNDLIDIDALYNRFKLYCESAKNCYSPRFFDKLQYLYAVTRHGLGLTIRTKNNIFIKILFKDYLLKR